MKESAMQLADLIERSDVQDVLHGVLALEGDQRTDLQLIICTAPAHCFEIYYIICDTSRFVGLMEV
jgi:hypothetical protein